MPTLQDLRTEHHISRERLANAAKMSSSTVMRAENGRPVNRQTIDRIIDALKSFGIEISQIEGIVVANHARRG